MKKYLILVSFIILSCNTSNSEYYDEAVPPMAPKSVETGDISHQENFSVNRKIKKEADIVFETDDLNQTTRNVLQAVKKYQAEIQSEREYGSNKRISHSYIIKVPSENFSKLIKEISRGVQKFEQKQIQSEDVTTQFIDISARLKTKKALEQKYLDLLKQAKGVKEIMEVEKELEKIRGQIESVEGQLKFLAKQTSMSTINLTFYKKIPFQTNFIQKFKKGFKQGWNNLILFLIFLVNLWPFIILGILINLYIKYYRKRH